MGRIRICDHCGETSRETCAFFYNDWTSGYHNYEVRLCEDCVTSEKLPRYGGVPARRAALHVEMLRDEIKTRHRLTEEP